MKLYKFELSTWKTTTISKEELEVEEKPKTYIQTNEYWKTRISKSDIGIASGYDNRTLYLLEDDMETAKKVFVEVLKNKISQEKLKLETTIASCNKRISEYENNISDLQNT